MMGRVGPSPTLARALLKISQFSVMVATDVPPVHIRSRPISATGSRLDLLTRAP